MTAPHRTPEWYRLTRRMRPIFQAQVDAGTAICLDCGWPIHPGQSFDIGHRLPASTHPHLAYEPTNLGPSHSGKGRACNRSAGARLGNKQRAERKQRSSRTTDWRNQ